MVYLAARSTRVGERGREEKAKPPLSGTMLKCSNHCQPSTRLPQRTSLSASETPREQQAQKGKAGCYETKTRLGLHPYWQIISFLLLCPSGVSGQDNAEWLWSQAFTQYTGSMGSQPDLEGLNLTTLVMHYNQIYTKQEWKRQEGWSLQGTIGEEIKIGCRMINGTTYNKVIQISVDNHKHLKVCNHPSELDCWYNFTLRQTVDVVCLWAHNTIGLSFKFTINAMAKPFTNHSSIQVHTKNIPFNLEPKVYEISPYVIRNTGQQKLLFNPEWSLKRVELLMETNISAVQPACSPFLRSSFERWTKWLQKQVHLRGRMRRDLTGMLGTGLGVLNGIDSEILMNKLAAATNDLTKLTQPLQSSLLALGDNQWQVSKVLPRWRDIEDHDHDLLVDMLQVAQGNISLALSCIQAQLWIQSTAALIIREGSEGVFPTEVRRVVWDNATDFERDSQSWWTLVNFTYNPTTNTATAFVLTIRNAIIHTIHPIVALGISHEKSVLYPSEHRVWAWKNRGKWQTINLEPCIAWEQQGFICENNLISAQDVCLDTDQGICHFEIRPDPNPRTVLVYIGNGCVCLRTLCDVIEIDKNKVSLFTRNHSNFCICNFIKVTGCNFNYSAPVVSHQLIKSNYTTYNKLPPTPIGMNLTLVKQLMKHQDLIKIIEEIHKKGQKTLVTVHHDITEINRVLQRVKKDASHNWWDALFGWSPTATGIMNTLSHPIIVLLILVAISLIMSILTLIWNWRMLQRVATLTSLFRTHGILLKENCPEVEDTLLLAYEAAKRFDEQNGKRENGGL
ncbi:uncharacterized protein LOC128782859 [Vidua chalybeata]|uniref:uncharacterized protein LOC128782859 n=1 Tax=Vidua chalybeata TaxID=81927 RepID=UPI0023A8C6E1|nr:uncharacterized protein LOC128782859 [Vidua chalybeata]